jgi:tetratricopeptide (TPR) repeat protein
MLRESQRWLPRARSTAAVAAALLLPPACAAGAPAPVPDAPYRAPYVPAADDDVLQQVPPATDSGIREYRKLRAQLDTDPKNARIAVALARAYVDFGRRLGDAHYAGYAEAVLAPWMAAASPPVDALVVQATILQFRHEFDGARRLLDQALTRDPRNAQAWLAKATLDMAQGDYRAAEAGCAGVARAAGFALSMACNGSLRSYLGHARQSVAMLKSIEDGGTGASPTYKAWIQGMLAESYERLGDWSAAEACYRKALAFIPDDNFLLVAYADFLLDRGRPAEVLDLLAQAGASDTAFLRITFAQAALKRPDASRYVWIMAARFAALAQRGSDYFGREQVRFALHLQHDPVTALALAERNWEVQRAPWDARVFLEAALAAERPDAATPVLEFLKRTRLEDPAIDALARKLRARRDNALAAR